MPEHFCFSGPHFYELHNFASESTFEHFVGLLLRRAKLAELFWDDLVCLVLPDVQQQCVIWNIIQSNELCVSCHVLI